MNTSKCFLSTLIAAAAMSVSAYAEDTVLAYDDLFLSEDGWSFVSLRNRTNFSLNTENETLSLTDSNWGQSYAAYELESRLAATESTSLTFSIDLTKQGNGMYSLALIGSMQVFCVGLAYDSDNISYAVSSDATHTAYGLGGNWQDGGSTYLGLGNGTSTGASLTTGEAFTVSGEVSYVDDSYRLSLTAGNTVVTYDLGSFFDVSKLVFAGDGANNTPNVTFSNLSLSGAGLRKNTMSLTWAGSDGAIWKHNDNGAQNWTNESDSSLVSFVNGDSVEFGTAASVAVAGTVVVDEMTVAAKTVFTGNGTIEVANAHLSLLDGGSIVLEEGIILDLGKDSGGTLNKNIAGAGKVIWVSTPYNHATKLTMRDDFVGTLQLSGNFKSSEASDSFNLGGTSKLVLDGVWFWGNGSTTITADVLLGENKLVAPNTGKGEMHVNSHYFSDGGSITYQKSFDASDKIVTITAGDTSFEGKTTIGTLNFSGGALAFSSDATVGTLSASGKTVTVNGGELSITTSAEIGTLSVGDSGMTLSGAGTKTVGTLSASGKTVTVNGGKLSITGDSAIGKLSGGGVLSVEEGGVLTVNEGLSRSQTAIGGTINVLAGGIAKFAGHDLMGWGGSETSVVAVLKGENDKLATLYLNDANSEGNATTLTFAQTVKMEGYSTISTELTGGNFDTFGGKIIATGTNNTISDVEIRLRKSFTIEVSQKNDSLDILSKIVNTSNEGQRELSMVKTGLGTLTLKGENTYSGGTTISQGTLVAAHANALGTGAVSVGSGATLKLATTVTGVGAVTLAEGAKFAIDVTGMTSVSPTAEGESVMLTILSSAALNLNGGNIEDYFDSANSNLGNWANWGREWTIDGGNLYLTLTIPEPSTFGLLAGLGALTLVGTRRRRKKA